MMKTEYTILSKPKPKPQPPLTGEAKQRDIALRQFRAYLHLAITARQTGREKEFKALPGPDSLTYCQALAKLPGHPLTDELARPVNALIAQLRAVAYACEARLLPGSPVSPAKSLVDRQLLADLDVALAAILRELTGLVKNRATVTDCPELLGEVLHGWLLDDGQQLEGWLVRYQSLQASDGRNEDGSLAPGSLPDKFARDTFARAAALDRLTEAFPDHLATAARNLPAWPLLAYRHVDSRPRLAQLAQRLELGAACPVNASEMATFDSDAPLVKYLVPLIARLENMRAEMSDQPDPSLADEPALLLGIWWRWPEQPPGEPVLAPLRRARQLPDLTRATADQWAREVFLPLILRTRICKLLPALFPQQVRMPSPLFS
jgi:hypothetical protein